MAGGVSWLLADFQHSLINSLCGVPDSQGGHGPLHGGPARSVVEDAADRLEQRLTGAVLLQQHRGAAGVFQDPCVFFLVVVGDIGEGTISAGTPSAVSSLMVEAPARQSTRSAARMTAAMS